MNRTWRNRFEFVMYRAWAEFRSEAARAYLGFLWWFLEPLLYMGAFYFVFAVGIRGRGLDYAPFLLCALVGWKWFSSSVLRASRWFKINSGIMQEIYVPKWLLVAVSLVNNFIRFMIILVLLFFFLLAIGQEPTVHWFGVAGVVLVQAIFITGCALLAAAIVPFLPDTQMLLDNAMMMLFFLSGIFFSVEEMSPAAQQYLHWNPLIHIFEGYRDLLLRAEVPDLVSLGFIALLGLAFSVAGFLLLVRNDRRYPRCAT